MKLFTKKDKRSTIDKEIDSVIEVMSILNANSDEYTAMAKNLEVLMKAKSYNKDGTKVSKDTVWTVVGSIASIVIIVGYEQAHIVASKAIGFVIKGRV